MKNIISVCACVLIFSMAFVKTAQAEDHPFSQGSINISIGLGMTSSFNNQYFVMGGKGGFFILDGLEAGLDGDYWVGGNPTIGRLSPYLTYILFFVDPIYPYFGVFYRHWFVGDPYSDFDTVGGRGGITYSMQNIMLRLGAVYERTVNECQGDCDWIYPEVSLSMVF